MSRSPITRKALEGIAILVLVVLAGSIRGIAYGDPRLSIGNGETRSYVLASRAPLFSWKIFAGRRLFTTNLIYKLANDPGACPLSNLSDPSGGSHARPTMQPCFDRMALLQNTLSILAWCALAWVTARWMTTFPAKIGVVAVILLFGFTPQIAEWDSVLSPESLTVSGYVALLALLEEIVLGVLSGTDRWGSRRNSLLVAAWLLLFTVWLFVRDVHLYALPVTVVMLGATLVVPRLRRQGVLWLAMGVLAGLFVLGYVSAQASQRATHYPLAHAFEDYILPFPDRAAYFQQFGMPDRTAASYQKWLDDNATRTYGLFLVSHPGFILSSIGQNLYYFRAEFVQQYYEPRGAANRSMVLQLSETLHPESLAVYLLDVLFIAGLWLAGYRKSKPLAWGWAWIATWFFLASGAILFVGFFGDAEAARRHIYPSVEAFRLLLWILLFVYVDWMLQGLFSDSPSNAASEPQP